ncbi:MAG: penicillin-binding protein 2 [Gammaproteobacteria bacterium]
MYPQKAFSKFYSENRLIDRRLFIAATVIVLLFAGLLLRIVYLQIEQHDHYTTLSSHNRMKLAPVPPTRGLIFSRDNVLLADNRVSFSLEVVPEKVRDMEQLTARLADLITIEDSDIRRFRKQLKQMRRFEGVPLRFNLSDEEIALVSVNQHHLPGVSVAARLNRYYPLSANLSHTIGYVGMIDEAEFEQLDKSNYKGTSHIGKIGVEKAYEYLLHGKAGYQQVEVNARGRIIRVLDRTTPVPGKNIHLTLHVGLQNLAVQELQGKRGAIVAIDPETGGILTSVSSPGYDPNLFVNGIDTKSYNEFLRSSDTPLLNRFAQGKYPPGSTIKPFLGLAALDLGIRESEQQTWCRGWYQLKGSTHRYRDWKKEGHGHTALVKAIAQSCDVYFYALAQDMGVDSLVTALAGFGFGKPTGIDIGGDAAGLLPTPEWKQKRSGERWYPGETLILGIGQGSALVTPLQLAVATAALANKGRVYQPHLLAEIRDPVSDDVLESFQSNLRAQVTLQDEAYWEEIIHSMHEVVHGSNGTARRTGAGAKYEFAGKTGTAQIISIGQNQEYKPEELSEELRDHALFIAFAPLHEPKIAIAIIVENGGNGSTGAAPIARRLFDYYLLAGQSQGEQG